VPAKEDLEAFVRVDLIEVASSSSSSRRSATTTTTSYDLVFKSNDQYPPLVKWFSAFPSTSLRQSQTAFYKSLFIIKNICDLQSRLASLSGLYHDLMKQVKK
jgi:hypothetical protein